MAKLPNSSSSNHKADKSESSVKHTPIKTASPYDRSRLLRLSRAAASEGSSSSSVTSSSSTGNTASASVRRHQRRSKVIIRKIYEVNADSDDKMVIAFIVGGNSFGARTFFGDIGNTAGIAGTFYVFTAKLIRPLITNLSYSTISILVLPVGRLFCNDYLSKLLSEINIASLESILVEHT